MAKSQCLVYSDRKFEKHSKHTVTKTDYPDHYRVLDQLDWSLLIDGLQSFKGAEMNDIAIESRAGRDSEYVEMANFVEVAQLLSLAKYVRSLYYDSNSCCCTIEVAKGVEPDSLIANEILDIALETITQFELFDTIEFGNSYYAKPVM